MMSKPSIRFADHQKARDIKELRICNLLWMKSGALISGPERQGLPESIKNGRSVFMK